MNPRVARTAVAVAVTIPLAMPTAGHAYQRPGATTRISVAFDGGQARDPVDTAIGLSSWETAISADGRFVAFSSTAANLVIGDVNNASDIFVRDNATNTIEVVSVGVNGTRATGACASGRVGSFDPSISADGRFVAFSSCATNLVPNDLNLDMDAFVYDRATDRTEIVSLSSAGKQGTLPALNHGSYASSISHDGWFVAFGSSASDLVPGDTNNSSDSFVYDRRRRTVERISVSSTEEQAATSTGSGGASLNADGRFAAFSSYASNLVTGDTNAAIDVFVRDRREGTTERISVRTGGTQTHVNGGAGLVASGGRAISADGRYVTFSSWASNLVPNDTNGTGLNSAFDIFVHDRVTKRIERISVRSDGGEATDDSSPGSISPDGRYVVIASSANNLSEGDTGINGSNSVTVGPQPGDEDVFIYDRKFGTMEMLSVAPDGSQAVGHCRIVNELLSEEASESFGPAVSSGGRYVAFQSCASNLVPGDTNGTRDNFLRHRGPHIGVGALIAVDGATVRLSGWSTFSGAVLAAAADPPADGALDAATSGAELIGGDVSYRPEQQDLFLRLNLTQIPAAGVALGGISAPGDPRVLYGFRFVANGATYEVRVHRAGVNAANPLDAAFGLFECTELVCNEVAPLRGGYGTTGEQIVVSIPLSAITKNGTPIGEGAVLSTLRAFTAYGGYYTGPTQLVDQLVLSTKPSVKVPGKSVTLAVGSTSARATVTNGRFAVSLPRRLFGRTTPVLVRTCLGSECQQSTVTVGL